jgi:16S rRNA (uracil1498-N3)-methyltransferase
MTRLFIANFLEEEFFTILDPTDINYLVKVMRKKIGAELLIFNQDAGEYLVEIIEITPKKLTVKIIKKVRAYKQETELNLIFAPIKQPRINFLLEKATELGVTNLIPIQTKHSVIDKINLTKWNIYVKEASEQCERISIPTISPLITLNKLLSNWQEDQDIILCNEKEKKLSLFEHIHSIKKLNKPINLMIGPEGGFSEQELLILDSKKFITSTHLGPRILRAETASLCAVSVIQNIIDN